MSAPLVDLALLGPGASLPAAVVLGIAFGWTLERAGLGSAPRLVGQFYLSNLSVFRVMFSAILAAMLGTYWLAHLGTLDLARVYVPETWLVPQLAGGLLFGGGLVVAGLCPGSSCVSAATGRADGLVVMLGMLGGVVATGLALGPSRPLRAFYEFSPHGAWTIPQMLHLPYGIVVAGVVALALGAFRLLDRLEKRA